MPVKDLCRKHGMASGSFYSWRAKYGGMEVSDAKRLKALEDEKRRLEVDRRRPGPRHSDAQER